LGRASAPSDPAECLRLLGLPTAASAAQIKRAYRVLAQRFHPDKCGDDEASRRHFIAICSAYRTLMRTARLAAKHAPVGRCCVCHEFGEVVIGLDGLSRCPTCVLRPGNRPLLPMPNFVIVNCTAAFVMLGLSAYLLLLAIRTESLAYALGSIAAGLGVLAVLAAICIQVVYCIQPHEQKARERAKHRRPITR
jgi:hypothetical protein